MKLSTLYLLVGLQEIAISIAIVKDPGVGLQQPVLVKGPSRLVVVINLLLIVVPTQVSDILELRDLYIVCPSRVESYVLLLYKLKGLRLVLVYIDVSIPLAKVRTLVPVVRPALGLLFSEPLLLLCLSVLVFQVIEPVTREVQHTVVGQSLLSASYVYKRVVKLESFFFKRVNELLRLLDLVSRLAYSLLGLLILLLSVLQLTIDFRELLSEVVSLLLKKHRVQSLTFVVVASYPLLSVVVLDYRDPLGLRSVLQQGQQGYISFQQRLLLLDSSSSSIHTPFCPIGMPELLQFSYKGNRALQAG